MATEEEQKKAYKAFKKRIKLMRLDEESGLTRGNNRKSGDRDYSPKRAPCRGLGRTRDPG